MAKYQIGDVVKLRSGSPAMTITVVLKGSGQYEQSYNTMWFSGSNPLDGTFPEGALAPEVEV